MSNTNSFCVLIISYPKGVDTMSGFEKDIQNLQEYRRNLDVTTKSIMMSKQDLHKVLRHIMATTNLINALKAQ